MFEMTKCTYCLDKGKINYIQVRNDIGTKRQDVKCNECGQFTRNRVFKTKIKKQWRSVDQNKK